MNGFVRGQVAVVNLPLIEKLGIFFNAEALTFLRELGVMLKNNQHASGRLLQESYRLPERNFCWLRQSSLCFNLNDEFKLLLKIFGKHSPLAIHSQVILYIHKNPMIRLKKLLSS